MSTLLDLFVKLDTLKTLVSTLEKKAEKGISLTVSISDDSNEYGQNVSAYVSQTKEQREAQVKRFYTGNGKVFWTDGKITKAEKKQDLPVTPAKDIGDRSDLPF
ncbi:hypothetical protein COZ71_08940 [Candidatus Desantisbacteria bacterium CG_4_8_14_3_um_filter_40_12]|uniref:Uncharacterized protein n=1 Tax=Candidatus Desantisbacteria bacterium CG_4_8_14_3_um_filter_40_12 TaxID=1974545 RepID=A0A2M7J984_9BACT|nr:MAG: hypothetical protein COZ71_08940 [Candidatus Desantisbacteria bacterium CG_4_8_14_3_um_filter_40_12]